MRFQNVIDKRDHLRAVVGEAQRGGDAEDVAYLDAHCQASSLARLSSCWPQPMESGNQDVSPRRETSRLVKLVTENRWGNFL